MRERIRAARENESGFTLIELLIVIVIVILGVLAGIVVFSVSGITDRGKASACKASLNTVQVASQAFYASRGAYAATMADLVPDFLQSTPDTVTYTIGTPPTFGWVAGSGCS